MKLRQLLPLVGILVFIYVLSTLDLGAIGTEFSRLPLLYSLLSFIAIIPVLLLSNVQWQVLLKKHGITIGFFRSLENILIGYFYGFITPGGLGAYTRTFYLQEETGAPLEKCIANVIIHNTIDYLSLLLLGCIGGLFVASIFPYLSLLLLAVLILVLLLLLSFVRKDSWRNLLKRLIQSNFFNPFREKLHQSIESMFTSMPRSWDLLLPFILSLVGWILQFTALFFVARLFSVDVPFLYFICIIAISNIVASVPITIYGLGLREYILITLFSLFLVKGETILSLSLFWFVIIWLTPSIFGGILALKAGGFRRTMSSKTFV